MATHPCGLRRSRWPRGRVPCWLVLWPLNRGVSRGGSSRQGIGADEVPGATPPVSRSGEGYPKFPQGHWASRRNQEGTRSPWTTGRGQARALRAFPEGPLHYATGVVPSGGAGYSFCRRCCHGDFRRGCYAIATNRGRYKEGSLPWRALRFRLPQPRGGPNGDHRLTMAS